MEFVKYMWIMDRTDRHRSMLRGFGDSVAIYLIFNYLIMWVMFVSVKLSLSSHGYKMWTELKISHKLMLTYIKNEAG